VSALLVIAMDAAATTHRADLDGLRASYEVRVIEPRWPECQNTIRACVAAVILVDGATAPSHGREVARWMAGQSAFRSTPIVFLDVADRDVPRVAREIPRAQFATWTGVSGVVPRLVRPSDRPSSI
jgi:hypothetical protein